MVYFIYPNRFQGHLYYFAQHAQFNIDGYVMHRLDHKSNSGGIIAYVRSDIPQKKLDLYVIGSFNKGRI